MKLSDVDTVGGLLSQSLTLLYRLTARVKFLKPKCDLINPEQINRYLNRLITQHDTQIKWKMYAKTHRHGLYMALYQVFILPTYLLTYFFTYLITYLLTYLIIAGSKTTHAIYQSSLKREI